MKKVTMRDYFDVVTPILIDFQFIEESLRMYIDYSYRIIEKSLNKRIPFKFTPNDYKKDSLGKLISKFQKVNSNEKLINKLKDIVSSRNACVHTSYLLNYEQQKNEEYLTESISALKKIKEDSKDCLLMLRNELSEIENIKKNL